MVAFRRAREWSLGLATGLAGVIAVAATAPALAQETVLWNFGQGSDGTRPDAALVLDGAGNLYGTTNHGGDHTRGTIFTIKTDGSGYAILHHFAGGVDDGAVPFGALVLDDAGNLYGTTFGGGSGSAEHGTVFTIKTDGTGFNVLYRFQGGASDGEFPMAGLILDATGTLYGTTTSGGYTFCQYNCGTVFSLATDGTNYRVLRTFPTPDCQGTYLSAPLVMDADGNLYSTTEYGPGTNNQDSGTIFKLSADGTTCEKLWTFTDIPHDGEHPEGGLILDGAGTLYGTTIMGGTVGGGIVFSIATDRSYTPLHNFGGPDGGYSQAGLVLDGLGNLYGTTLQGGASGRGTVFTLPTDGSAFNVLYAFTGSNDGNGPNSAVVLDGVGSLYGTTVAGGTHSQGVVFTLPVPVCCRSQR